VFIWSDVTDTTAGDFLYITDVQLEVGSVATPFERRPFGTELMLCQRYFQRINSFVCTTSTSTDMGGSILFPVTMRTAPSVSSNAAITTDDGQSSFSQSAASAYITGSGTTRITNQGGYLGFGNFTGLTNFRVYMFQNAEAARILLSAEL
jgi:subtilisin family serine protease